MFCCILYCLFSSSIKEKLNEIEKPLSVENGSFHRSGNFGNLEIGITGLGNMSQ